MAASLCGNKYVQFSKVNSCFDEWFDFMHNSGVGYAICIMNIYMAMCYNTIISWAVYYLFASFTSELPWMTCNNSWNTNNCTLITDMPYVSDPNLTTTPAQEFFEWVNFSLHTLYIYYLMIFFIFNKLCSFFRRKVLEMHLADGVDYIGPVKWSLALCLLAVFLLVYFSLWKGVRSTGKVAQLGSVSINHGETMELNRKLWETNIIIPTTIITNSM